MELNELSVAGTRLLDYSVSFGTGQFLGADDILSRNWLKYIIPEWVPRLGCCLSRALDADSMYSKFSSSLPGTESNVKHYRVQPSFRRSLVALDDPTKLKSLVVETERHMSSPTVRIKTHRLQLAMLASCFYVALRSPPRFDSRLGQYCAHLAVLCRWPEDRDICDSLLEKLGHASFLVNTLAHGYTVPLNCTVFVGTLDVPVEISLTLDGETTHPISGAPLSLRGLIYLQPPLCRSRSATGKRGGSPVPGDYSKRRCLSQRRIADTRLP